MKRTYLLAPLAGALGALGALWACGSPATGTRTFSLSGGAVINHLTLPTMREEFSTDLDGDGKNDNALSNIIAVLKSVNLSAQNGVNDSFDLGEVVMLLEVQSPTTVALYFGRPFMPACPDAGAHDGGSAADGCTGVPDFSGMGMFAIDSAIGPTVFQGGIKDGAFTSDDPLHGGPPLSVDLKLALVAGAPAVTLPTNGVHIEFPFVDGTVPADCRYGGEPVDLPCGKLQGSVRTADLLTGVLPPIGVALTKQLKDEPNNPNNPILKLQFDLGNCKDNGVEATAGDEIITACELANSALISNLLTADVQIFDDAGGYHPVPKGPKKDSLSLALGFTAVNAQILK